MPSFPILVEQTLRVERNITVDIEADTEAEAVRIIAHGDIDLPSAENPKWVITLQSVENETVNLAE